MLFPHLSGVRVDRVQLKGRVVSVQAHTSAVTVQCPGCGEDSRRVHSRYLRRLSDWSISGRETVVEVRVRRFFCGNGGCVRKIFAEPLPDLAARYGRHTLQAGRLLATVGLALGGRAGARLTYGLAVPVNRMTLIRTVRRIPDPVVDTPSVLGVDDFAIRRGHRYATILIDMHTHRPVDVLPDRDAETLAGWLRAHPGVGLICRDRSGSYAEGANRGVPGVPQVADRWHLLHNLSDHVEKAIARHRRCLRPPEPAPPTPPPAEQSPSRREANTRSRFTQVHDLKAQGLGTHIIAQRLGMDPKTVRRYADVASPDDLLGPALTGRRSLLDPYKPYLHARINEGVTATSVLLQEISARGYRGGERTLRRWLIDARQHLQQPTAPPVPASRTITGWIMRPADNLSEDDAAALKDACTRCPDIAAITELAHGFTYLVRQRAGTHLDDWIAKATAGPVKEIRGFAGGLRKDYDAVKAGLTLAWSSGAVEGTVNRIKMIKRQMFGRANLDLLRKRILIQEHPPDSITR